MLVLGIISIFVGYYLLFNVASDASVETIMRQSIAGIGLSIMGALFIAIWIFKRTR